MLGGGLVDGLGNKLGKMLGEGLTIGFRDTLGEGVKALLSNMLLDGSIDAAGLTFGLDGGGEIITDEANCCLGETLV